MRNISFAEKDFAAIYMMTKEEKDQIGTFARAKVKELNLNPTRKTHGCRFKESDLYYVGTDSDGNRTKTAIQHTVCVRDILNYIENVEVIKGCDVSKAACHNLCKLYVLTV